MRRDVAPPPFQLPPLIRHQLPMPSERVVGVVKVGAAEQEVAEFVCGDAELRGFSGTVR